MFVNLLGNSTINFFLICLFAAVMIFTVQGMSSNTGVLCNRPELVCGDIFTWLVLLSVKKSTDVFEPSSGQKILDPHLISTVYLQLIILPSFT